MRSPSRIALLGPTLAALSIAASPPRAGAQVTWLATGRQFPSIALLDRPARLVVDGLPLIEALRQLEHASGVALAYSPSLVPASLTVSCGCHDASLRDALTTLLAATRFSFRETDGQVLLIPASPPPGGVRAIVRVAATNPGDVAMVASSSPALTLRAAEPATIVGTITN